MKIQLFLLISLFIIGASAVTYSDTTNPPPSCGSFANPTTASFITWDGVVEVEAYESNPAQTITSSLTIGYAPEDINGPQYSLTGTTSSFNITNLRVSFTVDCPGDPSLSECRFDPNNPSNVNVTGAYLVATVTPGTSTTNSIIVYNVNFPASNLVNQYSYVQVVDPQPDINQFPNCSSLTSQFTDPADYTFAVTNREQRLVGTAEASCGTSCSASASISVSPSSTISISSTPSISLSSSPSISVSNTPSISLSTTPSISVSSSPSISLSNTPSVSPSTVPSESPSTTPSTVPSESPSTSNTPSESPSTTPSTVPSESPSTSNTPSSSPSTVPSQSPSSSSSASVPPSITPLVPSIPASPSSSPSASVPSPSYSPVPCNPTPAPTCVPTETCCCEERRAEQATFMANLEDLQTTANRINRRLNTVTEVQASVEDLAVIGSQVRRIQALLDTISQ